VAGIRGIHRSPRRSAYGGDAQPRHRKAHRLPTARL
jgi:hypothetical protein